MPHTLHQGTLDADTRQCVEECLTCQSICTTTVTYCLQRRHADPEHIVTLLDCAEICGTSASFTATRLARPREHLRCVC